MFYNIFQCNYANTCYVLCTHKKKQKTKSKYLLYTNTLHKRNLLQVRLSLGLIVVVSNIQHKIIDAGEHIYIAFEQ